MLVKKTGKVQMLQNEIEAQEAYLDFAKVKQEILYFKILYQDKFKKNSITQRNCNLMWHIQ